MRAITTPTLAVVALTILAGCTAAPVTADPSRIPETSPVATPTATPTPTPTPTESAGAADFGERIINDRGNLVKRIGQLAGIALTEVDDAIGAEFAVTDIVVDIDCTNEYADDPVNGHFVGIHLNVETTPELAQNDVPSVSFSPWGWQGFDANGKRVNDPVGNSFSCLRPGDQLPADIGPGQSVSGWIVLDMPTTSRAVALTMGADAGWEWSY